MMRPWFAWEEMLKPCYEQNPESHVFLMQISASHSAPVLSMQEAGNFEEDEEI